MALMFSSISAITPTLTDPIHALRQCVANAGARVVIGLVGLPGSGKSTWAQRWVNQLNDGAPAPIAQALGMDGFHLSRAELALLPDPQLALARRGAPWTFAPDRLRSHLRQLRATNPNGEPIPMRWPDFDHGVGDPVPEAIEVAPCTRLVVVEGLYLLLREAAWSLQSEFDAVWFLDVPRDQADRQLAARHCAAWGWTMAQAQARIASSDALNADTVAVTRCWAQAWVQPTD
jgi:pantothenate kinase